MEYVLKQRLFGKSLLPPSISQGRFNWLIIPCHGIDELMTDYIASAKLEQLKVMVAIDNWDNLTSKSVFAVEPDCVTVMGAKCVKHAFEIHGIDASKVLAFGLPRFDVYRELKQGVTKNLSSRRSKPRVLYAGLSVPHAERTVVNLLAKKLFKKYGIDGIEIEYRPHPIPLPRLDGGLVLNPHVKISNHLSLERTMMPNMDNEYVKALIESTVVIGAPTTFILEAMLLGRPCILDNTNDRMHRTTAGLAMDSYTHLQDLKDIKELKSADSVEEIYDYVLGILDSKIEYFNYEMSDLYSLENATYDLQLIEYLVSHS